MVAYFGYPSEIKAAENGRCMNDLYLDILDNNRKAILPSFSVFKDVYYLAGGTGLALQLGHRDSIDFDFFRTDSFSTEDLTRQLRKIFQDLSVIQEEKDTLTVMVNGSIKISFFSYPYPLIQPHVSSEFFNIASIEDIGCMKLSAVMSRSLLKDYIDLFFIIKNIPLPSLLSSSDKKFPQFNSTIALKSLAYFDDIVEEPILFTHGHEISMETVKNFLQHQVTSVMDQTLGND